MFPGEGLANVWDRALSCWRGRPAATVCIDIPFPSCKIWLMSEVEPTPQEQDDERKDFRMPLPPATFTFLVLSLRAQAEMQLGLMNFGQEEKVEPDMDLARHTIDLMAVLVEKTKGNLTLEEQRMAENSLTELRFRFVQISDERAKAAT